MKDNQVRQQARPKRNNYYANDNKKSYNKNNYQARGRRPMPRRKPSSVKIIPLGGLGQIGMNITAFECNNQILIVDVLLVHAQDHLMNSELAQDLIRELITLYKRVDALEKEVKELKEGK